MAFGLLAACMIAARIAECLAADVTAPPTTAPTWGACTQTNKHKALYASYEHDPPLGTVPALDVVAEVVWTKLDDLRAYAATPARWATNGGRGLYAAWPCGWAGSGLPGGYFGLQVTGKQLAAQPQKQSQMLFSLWDKNKGEANERLALPMHDNCKRNCNDCGVHDGATSDDGSTGTQCKAHYYPQEGRTYRVRIFREEAMRTVESYGRSVSGSVWTVTVQDMDDPDRAAPQVVGSQLIEGATQGLNRVNVFLEHIGCNPCGLYEEATLRRGPWVLDPPGSKLVRATSKYSKSSSCRRHEVTGDPDTFEVRFKSGGDYEAPPTWDKVLWDAAPDGVPLPPMPTAAPTEAPPPEGECVSPDAAEEGLVACRATRGAFAWTCDDAVLPSACDGADEIMLDGACRPLCGDE